MKPETNFYMWLRPKLPGHVVRIENAAAVGMPDLNICRNGREIWVELKIATIKQQVLLRKEQWAWGTVRAAHGGRVFIVALFPSSEIHVWHFRQFPKITAEAYGHNSKYVYITSPSDYAVPKTSEGLDKFLNSYLS